MKILIWDFDGVLVDTIRECYLITLATIGKEKKLIQKEAGISGGIEISFKDFELYRRHSVNAADFFANFILHKQGREMSDENLNAITIKHQPFLKRMDEIFYVEREKLMHKNKARYFETMHLYPKIPQTLKSLSDIGIEHCIMSARDTVSIRQILAHFHLTEYFDFIIGHEVNKGDRHVKRKQMELLKDHFHKKYPNEKINFYFIDDIPFNLKKVGKGANLLFARWGYGKMRPNYVDAIEAKLPKDLAAYFRSLSD
jgi:phosphoglycolate phosphatase-like HAD superfamily hydrolase